MVGGLLFSQVLTLYTTPVIYIFFDNLGQRFSRFRIGIEYHAVVPRFHQSAGNIAAHTAESDHTNLHLHHSI